MDSLSGVLKDQYDEFCEAWNFFDPEGKGFILTKDFGTVLRCLNITITEEQKIDLINSYDPENKGEINFNKFLDVLVIKSGITSDEEEIIAALKLFDKEKKQSLLIDKFALQLSEFPDVLDKIDIEFLIEKLSKKSGQNYIIFKDAADNFMTQSIENGFFTSDMLK